MRGQYSLYARSSNRGNKKTTITVDGKQEVFQSKKEAQRFMELRVMERAGVVRNVRKQVPFELIPTQRDENGRCIERSCKYNADFVYERLQNDGTWKEVVEDVKGFREEDYRIKRKLMLYLKGIRIEEV